MEQDRDKHWRELCQKAAAEQDPDTLRVLVAEIIAALDQRSGKTVPPVKYRNAPAA